MTGGSVSSDIMVTWTSSLASCFDALISTAASSSWLARPSFWCCNNCPRGDCPRRQLSKGLLSKGQLSKETVVQGDYCPRRTFVQGDSSPRRLLSKETVTLFIVQGRGLMILLDCRRSSHNNIVITRVG